MAAAAITALAQAVLNAAAPLDHKSSSSTATSVDRLTSSMSLQTYPDSFSDGHGTDRRNVDRRKRCLERYALNRTVIAGGLPKSFNNNRSTYIAPGRHAASISTYFRMIGEGTLKT